MKIFISTSISLVLFGCSLNIYASEFEFLVKDTSNTTKVCMAAVTDDAELMKRQIKRLSQNGTALSFRTVVNLIQCNKQYIGNFAKKYNAQDTFTYLDKYTNRKNKQRQANFVIKDIAYEQTKGKAKPIVVLVSSK
ncbi:MAG: hypothetical protein ACJAVV_000045 [Alphaproteobacteria bacterium]|jgi:hypothetical protein